MNIFHAVVLGIVEGLTEFLPVSSTGHLMMTAKLLGLEQTEFLKTFEIVIQTGAILAVLPLFIKTFFKERSLWLYSLIAFIPTALVGFLMHDTVKSLMSAVWIVGVTLIIGGIIMIVVEKYNTKRLKEGIEPIRTLSWISALYIGTCQAIAVIPGVSRSGATIIGGLARGFDRVLLVKFSFLLSVPTIAGAGAFDLYKSNLVFSTHELTLIFVGFVVAWFSAVLCVNWFIKYISTHTFIGFGWYRIVVGVIFLCIYLL